MNTKVKVDMHIHTTASDGTWDAEHLMSQILKKNIHVFSVTDHDCLDNNSQMSQLVKSHTHIKFIPGVEISSTFNDRTCHVLGYGIDCSNKELNTFLNETRRILHESDDKTIQLLETTNSNISMVEYLNYTNDPTRGGWKSLNYLKDKQICIDHKDYFRILDDMMNSIEKVKFPHIKDAIEIILQAGGIPVLAHPEETFRDVNVLECVDAIYALGIKGVECFHPGNCPQTTNLLLEFCKNNHLIITAGSDCHGEFVKSRELGIPEVELGQVFLSELLQK